MKIIIIIFFILFSTKYLWAGDCGVKLEILSIKEAINRVGSEKRIREYKAFENRIRLVNLISSDKKKKFKTVASKRFDIENIYYPVDQEIYDKVDRFLTKVMTGYHLNFKKIENEKQAEKFFTMIAEKIVKELDMQIVDEQLLLSRAITSHIFDCDTLATLYLAVGQILNLPIRAVAIPNHVFVRFYFEDGTYFNWETRTWSSKGNQIYIEEKCLEYNDFEVLDCDSFIEKFIGTDLAFYYYSNL